MNSLKIFFIFSLVTFFSASNYTSATNLLIQDEESPDGPFLSASSHISATDLNSIIVEDDESSGDHSLPTSSYTSDGDLDSISIEEKESLLGKSSEDSSGGSSISLQYLRKLQDHIITEGQDQSTTAVSIYPLSSRDASTSTGGDVLDELAQKTDRLFFQSASKKVVVGGAIAGLLGATVPYPSMGYINFNVGNFLQIPVGEVASDLLITWVVVTTTPVFFEQFFNRGKIIVSHIFRENPFSSTSIDNDHSTPLLFKKSRVHNGLKAALMVSSMINAAIPLILMREAEGDFPMFFAFMATPFYLSWLENYYKVGSYGIDRFFEYYIYAPRTNYDKREILITKIEGFKKEIQKNEFLTEEIYNIIQTQMDNSFPNSKGNAFAFSSLFIRNMVRQDVQDQENAAYAYAENFKRDMDAHPHSWKDDFISAASIALTGAGFYAKYAINQAVLYGLMTEFGISQQTAEIFSSCLAGFDALNHLPNHNAQVSYLQKMRNFFSPVDNLMFFRRSGGVASFINAGLFSLPKLVEGLIVFNDSSLISKILQLGPAFLMDVIYHDSFFNTNTNGFITRVSTIWKSKNIGLVGKRAFLHKYANDASALIHDFDEETIEKLYQIIQQGV